MVVSGPDGGLVDIGHKPRYEDQPLKLPGRGEEGRRGGRGEKRKKRKERRRRRRETAFIKKRCSGEDD